MCCIFENVFKPDVSVHEHAQRYQCINIAPAATYRINIAAATFCIKIAPGTYRINIAQHSQGAVFFIAPNLSCLCRAMCYAPQYTMEV